MNDVLKFGLLAAAGYIAWQYFATPSSAAPSTASTTPAAPTPTPSSNTNTVLSILQATNPSTVVTLAQQGGPNRDQVSLPASGLFTGYQWQYYATIATGIANLPGIPNGDQQMSFQSYWAALLAAAAAPGAGLSGLGGNYVWGRP